MPSIPNRRATIARAVVIVGAAALVLGIAWRTGLLSLGEHRDLAAAIDRVRDVPYLAPLFIVTYSIGAAAGVPATPFTIAGGALFGAGWGIALNWTGELLAALLAFGAARATGLRKGARATAVDETATTLAAARATRTLFRLRLIPIAPFALLNVGAALSGMRWRNFATATALGILPITIIYTVLASELVDGAEGSGTRAFVIASISGAVLIAASLLPAVIRRLRRPNP